jgi:hypothetical protein
LTHINDVRGYGVGKLLDQFLAPEAQGIEVADFLMHFIPGIASLPNPEFHGPTALAVLIVRTLKVK